MLKVYHYEDKTATLALEKALKELNQKEEDLLIKTSEIQGKLFKSKKYELEIIVKEDISREIKSFIKELGNKMNLDIQVEVTEKDNVYSILLVSNNNAILIGKDGKTLNAVQLLLKQVLNNNHSFNIKINLDVANYKNKKIRSFEYEIKKLAKEVLNTKVEAKLDPMNSYERRIVHTIVSEFEELETESIGEEPNRYVVIKFKEN